MSDNLHRLLGDDNKEADKASGILARLFRLILRDRNMSMMGWSSNMARYLNDPRNGCPQNNKDRSSVRGNLTKELLRPTMTWKVFKKAIRFLAPQKIDFIVRCHWGFKSKMTVVMLEIRNDQLDEKDDTADDDIETVEPTQSVLSDQFTLPLE